MDRPITDRTVDAALERRHASGRIFDVALVDARDDVLLGIGVLVTHRVDADKERALGDQTWIELQADALEDPVVWRPERAGGRLPPDVCAECHQRPLRRRRETVALAARYGMPEPPEGYFAIEIECWKCHHPTVLFFWPGIGVGRTAPEPWPPTVKVRYSRTVQGSYLSNGCARCDALQGDFYLLDAFHAAVGGAPDALELQERFFEPETEEEWERLDRGGLTVEEMVNIVVPPWRP